MASTVVAWRAEVPNFLRNAIDDNMPMMIMMTFVTWGRQKGGYIALGG